MQKVSKSLLDSNLDDVTAFADALSDFADIDGVVVAFGFRVLVGVRWILPCLRQSAVVPDVTAKKKLEA